MELNDRIDPVTRSSRCVHSYRRQSCTPFHENAQYYCDRKTVRVLQENRPDKRSSFAIEKYLLTQPPNMCAVKYPGNKPRPMVPSFTSPSIINAVGGGSKRRSSRQITFGYASIYPFSDELDFDPEWYEDDDLDEAGTSFLRGHEGIHSEGAEERREPMNNCAESLQNPTLFFLRYPDQRIATNYCFQLIGAQADHFIQLLSEKNKESLKKFITREKPDECECFVWILDDTALETTVVSIKTLENHFKNKQIRRVNWRHLSFDKISVYRYSLPVITSKFRLRLAHFLARNYRCCILCVWCLVITVIAFGIVLSVVFGSTDLKTTNSTDAIPMIQGSPPPPYRILPIVGAISSENSGRNGPILYSSELEQWQKWKQIMHKNYQMR